MSVGFGFGVQIRPYSGYDRDPSFPIATWIAEGGAVGNASGGVLNMDFLFQRDGPQISELFNLEQIAADTSSAVSRDFSLETLNMDTLATHSPATDQRWKLATRDIAHLSISALLWSDSTPSLWLGTPNRNEGDAGLRFQWPNIDLLLYFMSMQGYMWGPRSVLAEGGPRRPLSGLYGNE